MNDSVGNCGVISGSWTYRQITPPRQSPTLRGAFYRSALYPLVSRINTYLVGWVRKKYKRLRSKKKARVSWEGITERYPQMFAHWKWVASVQRV